MTVFGFKRAVLCINRLKIRPRFCASPVILAQISLWGSGEEERDGGFFHPSFNFSLSDTRDMGKVHLHHHTPCCSSYLHPTFGEPNVSWLPVTLYSGVWRVVLNTQRFKETVRNSGWLITEVPEHGSRWKHVCFQNYFNSYNKRYFLLPTCLYFK